MGLHQDSNKRGFWPTGYNRAYHDDFRLMVDLERSAELLRCLESEIAPDLLQSEAYIRALFAAHGSVLPFKERASGTQVATRPFILIRVPSPGVAGPLELAYIQGEQEIRYIDDKKALAAYETAWRILVSAALPAEDSRRFIRYIRDRNYKESV